MNAPKFVAYLAHPLGSGTSFADLATRTGNIANTLSWLRFLVDQTAWSICVPWLPYVQVLDEGTYRDRGIADDLAVLERCDVVVAAGGRWSAGMSKEATHASGLGIPIVDLTSWGFAPPVVTDEVRAALALRVRQAAIRHPRRVWLPPLAPDQVADLKACRFVCRDGVEGYTEGFGPGGVHTLDSIIAAAETLR